MEAVVALVAAVLVLAIALYAVTGGADFGGGVWDALATGPRAAEQRRAIERAIGPIWEANHVWLILALVVLWVGFPEGYAVVLTALHLPLSLMLLCIVLRGAAFVFRHYDGDGSYRTWSRLFAVGSIGAPVMLGIVLGALTVGFRPGPDLLAAWWAPFPLAVGAVALLLCAWLAAVYLRAVTTGALQADFAARARGAAAVAALGLLAAPWLGPEHVRALWLSGVPVLFGLVGGSVLPPRPARLVAAATVLGVVVGWAVLQLPWLVHGELELALVAAPEASLRAMLGVLGVALALVVPAMVWLYRVFEPPR